MMNSRYTDSFSSERPREPVLFILPKNLAKGDSLGRLGYVQITIIRPDSPQEKLNKIKEYLNDERLAVFSSAEKKQAIGAIEKLEKKLKKLDIPKAHESKMDEVRVEEMEDGPVEEIVVPDEERFEREAPRQRLQMPEKTTRRLEEYAKAHKIKFEDLKFVDKANPENVLEFDGVESLDKRAYADLAKEINELFSGVLVGEEKVEVKEKKKAGEMHESHHTPAAPERAQDARGRKGPSATDIERSYIAKESKIKQRQIENSREARAEEKKRKREAEARDDLKRDIIKEEVKSADRRSDIHKGRR